MLIVVLLLISFHFFPKSKYYHFLFTFSSRFRLSLFAKQTVIMICWFYSIICKYLFYISDENNYFHVGDWLQWNKTSNCILSNSFMMMMFTFYNFERSNSIFFLASNINRRNIIISPVWNRKNSICLCLFCEKY
jgi:hypothetical protein